MRAHALSPAALILVLLIGCGGSGERPSKSAEPAEETGEYRPPPDLAQIDLCELLPPPEIPARFGQVTEGPTLTRNPNGWPTCSYVLAPNTGLVVELMESQWFDMNRDVWGPGRTQEIDGIGEKAYLVPLKPPSDPHLIAAKGYVAVKVTTRNIELAREAARTILAKL